MTENTFDTAAAEAAGVQTSERVQANYWGFEQRDKFFLPDGVSYIEIKKMNEGDKSSYQSKTRSDIRLQRNTGDAHMKADPAVERKELILSSVCGWNLLDQQGNPIAFNKTSGAFSFVRWMEQADPKIIEGLEKAIRKFNPWLLSDMSVEDIDREIENLQEMREEALKRQEGE